MINVPSTLPPINISAYNAFNAVQEQIMNLHKQQFGKESVGKTDTSKVLTKIAVYHLCLVYALRLKVLYTDPLNNETLDYWKTKTDYSSLKTCASAQGVDLDAIISNTI